MTIVRPLAIAVLITVAGCSKPASDSQLDSKDNAAAAIIANSAADPVPGLPVSETPSPAKAAKTLPPGFLGRWGINSADCDVSRGDTKGLLTITDDKLRFYESRATIKQMREVSQYKVVLDLAFEGEGQQWERQTMLELVTGGIALVRTETDPAETYKYQRC